MLPGYFDCLKKNHIETFLRDEHEFRKMGLRTLDDAIKRRMEEKLRQNKFEPSNSSEHDEILPDHEHRQFMVGNPCYQISSASDYQMYFNNQNDSDEIACKLLLMLPMVPKSRVEDVKLNHLRLFHKTDTMKSGSNYNSNMGIEMGKPYSNKILK